MARWACARLGASSMAQELMMRVILLGLVIGGGESDKGGRLVTASEAGLAVQLYSLNEMIAVQGDKIISRSH